MLSIVFNVLMCSSEFKYSIPYQISNLSHSTNNKSMQECKDGIATVCTSDFFEMKSDM